MRAFQSEKSSSIPFKVGGVVLVLVLAIISVVLLWEPGSRLPKERAKPLPLEEEQVDMHSSCDKHYHYSEIFRASCGLVTLRC